MSDSILRLEIARDAAEVAHRQAWSDFQAASRRLHDSYYALGAAERRLAAAIEHEAAPTPANRKKA